MSDEREFLNKKLYRQNNNQIDNLKSHHLNNNPNFRDGGI